MKKRLLIPAVLLILSMLLSAGAASYNAGTYTGTSQGHNDELILEVTFSTDRIEDVKIISHTETEGIGTPALEKLPVQIVELQSLGIDTFSGATYTSNAIISAVADAVNQAGGDAEALKAVKVPEIEITKTIEKSADVVIIGAGGAGLAAAIEASDKGASVILLEKMPAIGGTTFVSQGVLAGYGTKISKKLDVNLTYDQMYDNLMGNALYRLDPELTRITVEKSGETIDWLQDRVKVPFLEEIRVDYGPLQMMHVMDGDLVGGVAMNPAFSAAIEKAKVDLMLDTRASEIIMDENGHAVGVKAIQNDASVTIHAKSVIIATGGYANNAELAVLLDPEMAGTMGVGWAGSTGDGLIMASNAGAALSHTNIVMCVIRDYEIMTEHAGTKHTASVWGYFASPSLILVGKDATRFMDEKSVGYMNQDLNRPIFNQMNKDQQGFVWAISSTADLEKMGQANRKLDMEYLTSDTAEGLAEKMGVDAQTLKQTITEYNGFVEEGVDPHFGRTELEKLEGPFSAVAAFPCMIITYGGVARNDKSEVLRADGRTIPGLYVAGEASANSSYMGFTLSNAFTWGRIAGANAAEFAAK